MTLKMLGVAALALLLVACGGAEEREAKYVERGKALYEEGDFARAQIEFRNALRINPKGVEATFYLGQIAEQQGNWQAAFATFSRVVEEDANHAQAHLKLAGIYLLAGELDEAEAKLDTFAALSPGTAEEDAFRGGIALRRDQPAEGQRLAEAALAKKPGDVGAAMVLASALARQGDPDAALASLDRALEQTPGDAALRLLGIRINLDNNRFDAAVAGYRALIEVQPEEFAHRLTLARLFAARDQVDEAEAVLRLAVEAGVGGTQAQTAIVDLLAQRSGFAAAAAELASLIEAQPKEYSFQFKLAELYANNDRLDDAVATLARVVETDGTGQDGLNARVALARLALARQDREEAKTLADAVLESDPTNGEALLIRGALALDAGDVDGALADARTVLRGAPRSAPALRLLVQTQLRRNEPQLAMETLGQLIDVEPNDLAAREQLAGLNARSGNLETALDLFNASLARAPNRPPALLGKAETLISLRRWEQADATIREILAIPEQQAAGHLLTGRRYRASGDPESAVQAFRQAAAARPTAAEPVMGIVQSYLAADRADDALAYLDEVMTERPDEPFLLNMKGEVLARQGQVDAAAAAFRAAIATQPGWDIPHANLGNLFLANGRGAEGIAAYVAGLEALPDNPRLIYGLGAAQEREGDFAGAIATYERILELQPESEVAANNFAALVADFAYQDAAQLARALDLARRFETSDNPLFLDTLGWVLYRTGDFAQARIYLDRAVQARGDVPILQYHLGMTLYRLGDKPGALAALERAVAGDAPYPGKDEAAETLTALSQS